MKPENNIPVGGYLRVNLPSDDSLMAVLNSNLNVCTSVTGFTSNIDCEVDSTTQFRILNGFGSTAFTTDGTADLSFQMNGIRNPRSFKQTSSFTFTTFDASNFEIDSKNAGITTEMTIVSNLHNAEFATSSEQNAATLEQSVTTAFTASDYIFTFTTLSQLGTDN